MQCELGKALTQHNDAYTPLKCKTVDLLGQPSCYMIRGKMMSVLMITNAGNEVPFADYTTIIV